MQVIIHNKYIKMKSIKLSLKKFKELRNDKIRVTFFFWGKMKNQKKSLTPIGFWLSPVNFLWRRRWEKPPSVVSPADQLYSRNSVISCHFVELS